MTTRDRIQLLAQAAELFEPWTGLFDAEVLLDWIAAELGHPDALDRPVSHGPLQSRARAPRHLLHVVSQNTPHAAFQSLLRGLVIGSRNTIKLPSDGLSPFEEAVSRLPAALRDLVELVPELPADWTERVEAVLVFGSDETLDWFAAHTPATVRLIPHGTKLSIALVTGDDHRALQLAVHDVCLFDQRGCLSIHDIYLASSATLTLEKFAYRLAETFHDEISYQKKWPRAPLDDAQAGSITSLRESVRFFAASQPDQVLLLESPGTTDWTVVRETDPAIKLGPQNRFVYVKPWPEEDPRSALGPHRRHLASIALHPFDQERAAALLDLDLGANRICPLGQTQSPSLFWHHDGLPPLASLVTWVDLG